MILKYSAEGLHLINQMSIIRMVGLFGFCWAVCTWTLLWYPFKDIFGAWQVIDRDVFGAPDVAEGWQRDVAMNSDDTMSACLLVMDDSHFLVEWLGYHYHTLPLRYLVVAVDPRSQTSPTPILDRWRNKKDGMEILEWQDEDYMSEAELEDAKEKVRYQFGNITSNLVTHRARQRLFYYKCMKKLKEEGRSWTLMTDTDEFLRVNYKTIDSLGLRTQYKVPSIKEPASVRSLLQAELQRPGNNLTKSPCIQIPRLRFGAQPSSNPPMSAIPEGWDSSKFLTLLWRKHAGYDQYWANKISKVMIDVSQVNWNELVPVESIHRPIKSLCTRRNLHVRSPDSVLVINHYLGSWEQYAYRNDARKDDPQFAVGRSRKVRRNASMVHMCVSLLLAGAYHFSLIQILIQQYERQKKLDMGTNDDIRPWLQGFVQAEGDKEAHALLKGVGVLEPKDQFDNAFMPKQAEKERCAVLFFGLPRSFKDLVLPSLEKNLIAPNARYNCDYFVHYYHRTEEPEGRANKGGKLDPTEILLLEDAVKRAAAAKTRKLHDDIPTVQFLNDTEDSFWATRNNTIQKYRNTKDKDGNYLYFPWKALSYHYPSSLDNIVSTVWTS
jgi:hypothetical protein